MQTWRSFAPSWKPSQPLSTFAWTLPMATQSILWSLSSWSEKGSLNTPSWWGSGARWPWWWVSTLALTGRYLCLQAGNVVTGEMVEELILSGADIIKVGIGPGGCGLRLLSDILYGLCPPAFSGIWNTCGRPRLMSWDLLFAHRLILTWSRSDGRCRVSVHNKDQNRSGLPSAQRCDRVCRFSSWP